MQVACTAGEMPETQTLTAADHLQEIVQCHSPDDHSQEKFRVLQHR
jgi:hypothetical protein